MRKFKLIEISGTKFSSCYQNMFKSVSSHVPNLGEKHMVYPVSYLILNDAETLLEALNNTTCSLCNFLSLRYN